MSASQDLSREDLGTYRLPDTLASDIENLGVLIQRTLKGEMSPAELRAHRVPMGCYEQRERGTFMLRLRLPGGEIRPAQMRTVADVSRRYGNGVLHVTTRQDIQVHGVKLEGIYPAMKHLLAAGIATKGGGGNTVRNITACERAGVCVGEAFDVTPYAVGTTEYLLPDPLSYQLPRKYKIGFSGCPHDCSGGLFNDVGFIAKIRDGVRGFTVYAGGGMGNRSRVADRLEEFIPASECHLVAEAIKRVFDKHGNRKNKHRARLRFLVEKIGFEAFRQLYQEERTALKASAPSPLSSGPDPSETAAPARAAAVNAPADWLAHNVIAQKQAGYHVVTVPLALGDIAADTFELLADVAEQHGEGQLRATQQQNLALRWIADDELATVHDKLAALGLADALPSALRNLVACAGASTCQLGICLSRGLTKALVQALTRSDLDLPGLGDLTIHVNGCPNSCGRHPIADIGLCGAARRVNERLVPFYIIMLGGRGGEGRARLAAGDTAVPARNVPAYLVELLRAYQSSGASNFDQFVEGNGRAVADELAAAYQQVPDFDEDKNYYFDWGASELFSLAGRGPGECSAGVFDLIDVDLTSAAEALNAGRLYPAAALAARALLITLGEQPADDAQAFELFRRHFLAEGPEALQELVADALQAAAGPDPAARFAHSQDEVAALLAHVRQQYDNMDASLRLAPPTAAEMGAPPVAAACSAGSPVATAVRAAIAADVEHDFRTVACPLNYVKTTMALSGMQPGQVLSVLLNDEGAANVPDSVRADGHEVLAVSKQDDHWQVLIRKQANG